MKNTVVWTLILSVLMSQTAVAFEDVPSEESEIYFLKDSGVVEGRSEGRYEPLENVNRAEMLKILLESGGISPDPATYKNCFPDVHEEWFAKYVCYAREKGMINGYPDGYFKPENPVNMAEALKMSFNAFNIDLEDENGEWFSAYVDTARNYDITENSSEPSQPVSRGTMAKLVVHTAIVGATEQAYLNSELVDIRSWNKKIQDFQNSTTQYYIKNKLQSGNFGINLKITALAPQSFKFEYGNEVIIASKGDEDLDKDPIIEVRPDGVNFGINADFRWDGEVEYDEDESLLTADVDLTGLYGASVNLEWTPGKSMTVYSNMGKEITNITEESDFPIEMCVSDASGYLGMIRVLSTSVVELGECPGHIEFSTPIEAMVAKLKNAWGPKPVLPIWPQRPKNKPGNIVIEEDGIVNIPEGEEPEGEDPFSPITESGSGNEAGNTIPQFPKPENHPGKYSFPKNGYSKLENAVEKLEENNAKAAETAEDIEDALNQIIKDAEQAFEKYEINKPAIPSFNPTVCCPEYDKEGKCCTGIDLNTPEGRAEYQKRINCLVNAYNENQKKLEQEVNDARKFETNAKDLARMEANFGQLAAALKLNKIMAHLVIDVVTGGEEETNLKGVISKAISNIFGDAESAAFEGITDPSTLAGNYGEMAANAMISKLTDFKSKVGKVAEIVADKLGLTGFRKTAFVDNAKEKFGEAPLDMYSPATWSKFIYDSVVNEAGSAAENILKTIQKLKEDRNENYQEAWKTAQLLKQINTAIKKAKTEECGKKLVEALKKEIEKRKEKLKEYYKMRNKDAESIKNAILWILEYEIENMTEESNPDSETVKKLILKELQKRLCKLGYDLCWVDIDFEVTWKKSEDGTIEWYLKIKSVKPRATKKEACECGTEDKADEVNGNSTENNSTDDSDGTDNEIGGESDSTTDTRTSEDQMETDGGECCDCINFIPEEYMGIVKYSFIQNNFTAVEFGECILDVPEFRVHDRILELYPENGEEVYSLYITPENDGVEFDLESGAFYKNGEEIYIL